MAWVARSARVGRPRVRSRRGRGRRRAASIDPEGRPGDVHRTPDRLVRRPGECERRGRHGRPTCLVPANDPLTTRDQDLGADDHRQGDRPRLPRAGRGRDRRSHRSDGRSDTSHRRGRHARAARGGPHHHGRRRASLATGCFSPRLPASRERQSSPRSESANSPRRCPPRLCVRHRGSGSARGSQWSGRPSQRPGTEPQRCTIQPRVACGPRFMRWPSRRACGSTSISTASPFTPRPRASVAITQSTRSG